MQRLIILDDESESISIVAAGQLLHLLDLLLRVAEAARVGRVGPDRRDPLLRLGDLTVGMSVFFPHGIPVFRTPVHRHVIVQYQC